MLHGLWLVRHLDEHHDDSVMSSYGYRRRCSGRHPSVIRFPPRSLDGDVFKMLLRFSCAFRHGVPDQRQGRLTTGGWMCHRATTCWWGL